MQHIHVPMLLYCDKRKKVIYVRLGGDLMADKAEIMRKELNSYTRDHMETLVLDLARVKAIDSTSLNTVVEICNLLGKSMVELIIENASPEIKKLFRRIRVNGRLTISQTGWPT